MKRAAPFFWLFIAIVVQASLLKYFSLFGASLNLVLIFLLLSVFEKSRYQRIIFGAFFSGWLLGGLSGLPFGSVAIAMMIAILLLDWLLLLLPHDSFIYFLILVICGTLIYNGVLIFVLSVMKFVGLSVFSPGVSLALAAGVALEIIFNLLGASIIYLSRKWIIL